VLAQTPQAVRQLVLREQEVLEGAAIGVRVLLGGAEVRSLPGLCTALRLDHGHVAVIGAYGEGASCVGRLAQECSAATVHILGEPRGKALFIVGGMPRDECTAGRGGWTGRGGADPGASTCAVCTGWRWLSRREPNVSASAAPDGLDRGGATQSAILAEARALQGDVARELERVTEPTLALLVGALGRQVPEQVAGALAELRRAAGCDS